MADRLRYFRRFQLSEPQTEMHRRLRDRERQLSGRDKQLMAVVTDSSTVRATGRSGIHGCNIAKKLNGRKRHIPVVTGVLLIRLEAHAAEIRP